ncbi:MBL fold metallo-hydrolase [Roseisolibacter sp. H3M3-2]|uniref:MBL fold metallo-hydrolase n=1 Tax=Roseisolibacter sp. H3M3-2 TaxID=3031323 RepID=UPI0023D97A11|nr:MBL fold metallo-hydrolase [Roseisolibacter sp. H3M3-2]MDF1505090.1 MBL fold metallo-hydrolase [Roseisolibacter sp. H3M3-2]
MTAPAVPPPPPSVETFRVGRLTVHAVQAGGIRLDGGAMFGVVPKPLWERRIPADDRNRIGLGMRCLVIEHAVGPIVVDTGLGNKENARFADLYALDNAGTEGRTRLEDGLRAVGIAPTDVRLVINTHLHFDHAGGNTWQDASGTVRPTFPNARYVWPRGEYHYATNTNERTAASYLAHNFVPLMEAGLVDEVVGEGEIVPGVRTLATPGHTPFHQSVVVEDGGETLCFLGDVCPTAAHLPLPWIMGYDVEPLATLESKRRVLRRAADEGWLLMFEHDLAVGVGRVAHDGKSFALVDAASRAG